MEQIEEIKMLLADVINTETLGADVGTWLSMILIFSFFLFLRGIISRVILRRVFNLFFKKKGKVDKDDLFSALEKPLSFLIVSLGLFAATSLLEPSCSQKISNILNSFEKSLIAIAVFWLFYNN